MVANMIIVSRVAGLLDREQTVAAPGFNRWLVPPAALAIHLCIGSHPGRSRGALHSRKPEYRIGHDCLHVTASASLVQQVEQLKAQSGVQRVAEFIASLAPIDHGSCVIALPYDKVLIAARLGLKPEWHRALSPSCDWSELPCTPRMWR